MISRKVETRVGVGTTVFSTFGVHEVGGPNMTSLLSNTKELTTMVFRSLLTSLYRNGHVEQVVSKVMEREDGLGLGSPDKYPQAIDDTVQS